MTTRELATQLVRDAMALRKAPLPLRESYEISQRIEEASEALERLARIEDFYDAPQARKVKP